MSETSPVRESDPESGEVTYDSVTIHYQADGEEPFTVEQAIRFVDCSFTGSGKRALQVIDEPRNDPPRGLLSADMILIPPDEIS